MNKVYTIMSSCGCSDDLTVWLNGTFSTNALAQSQKSIIDKHNDFHGYNESWVTEYEMNETFLN